MGPGDETTKPLFPQGRPSTLRVCCNLPGCGECRWSSSCAGSRLKVRLGWVGLGWDFPFFASDRDMGWKGASCGSFKASGAVFFGLAVGFWVVVLQVRHVIL